ncbi:quinone oxidoreductase family protein [Desulfofustis glycolicus]|uniref:NADPH2:quinone reductase n=1 Tax=Desulfofustis glycolicus DSM 9705 TaxID=1121409 RepID=A0A1M5XZZ4_9BACT|nr:quinone oxidoreductase [Desulfofustis glycolicus]SHI05286.1 NADPH2:quinone reductase [Desulfofustis glycolicus DSM 9705]
MGKAIVIHRTGGPDVLSWESHDPGSPGPEEVRIVHEAIGLNYIDVYHRSGLYPLPSLPAVLGLEGAGRVEAIGAAVTGLAVGDRVAYAGVPAGAYAEARCIPAHRLIKLPEQITSRQAAAMMLQGMTARYLLHGCYRVERGSTILVHAAAGGVGSILSQWAAHRGATVIGTAGSEEKAEFARSNGCSTVILYRDQDVAETVREVTAGRGVDAVYDSVGRDTFLNSLDCLRPMGTMVSFGQSSGPVDPFDLSLLAAKGSLFLTRPSLMHYTAKREDLEAHAADLFDVVLSGAVRITIAQEYPLHETARAHQDLEARRTSGSSVLIP